MRQSVVSPPTLPPPVPLPKEDRWAGWPKRLHFEQPFCFPAKHPASVPLSSPAPWQCLPPPPLSLGSSEKPMGSGGIGATLLYDWEMDERRFATSVGQLLPSVWWDVAREGLAHSLVHHWAGPFV